MKRTVIPYPTLFIDFLVCTVEIPKARRKLLHKRMSRLITEINNRSTRERAHPYTPQSKRYLDNVQYNLVVNGKPFSLKINANPINDKQNYSRFEFNPDAAGTDGIRRVIKILIYLLGYKAVKRVYKNANVTRIDFAVDLDDIDQMPLAYGKRQTKSRMFVNDEGEKTQYLGSRESPVYARWYDKNAEQGIEGDSSKHRFEIQLNDVTQKLFQLAQLDNPFSMFHFYKWNLDPDYYGTEFVEYAHDNGLADALYSLSCKKDRDEMLQDLKLSRVHPFDVDLVWAQLLKAIKPLQLFKPESIDMINEQMQQSEITVFNEEEVYDLVDAKSLLEQEIGRAIKRYELMNAAISGQIDICAPTAKWDYEWRNNNGFGDFIVQNLIGGPDATRHWARGKRKQYLFCGTQPDTGAFVVNLRLVSNTGTVSPPSVPNPGFTVLPPNILQWLKKQAAVEICFATVSCWDGDEVKNGILTEPQTINRTELLMTQSAVTRAVQYFRGKRHDTADNSVQYLPGVFRVATPLDGLELRNGILLSSDEPSVQRKQRLSSAA